MISSSILTNPNRAAVVAILVAVLTISFSDALVKLLSADFSLWQIFTLRSLIYLSGTFFIAQYFRFRGLLRVKRMQWILLRNALMILQVVLYYMALPNLMLSVAAASIYTMPLFSSLLAILFLSEKGGTKLWVSVLFGYAGVLLVVQPQSDEFNYYVLLPLGAALLAALSNLVTKAKCADEHPVAISFNLNLMLLGVGTFATALSVFWNPIETTSNTLNFLLRDWADMGVAEWSVMSVMAIAFGIGSIAAAFAYQIGPVSRIATLDYFYIAFAVFWGAVLFTELPMFPIVFGIALITLSGMLAIRIRA